MFPEFTNLVNEHDIIGLQETKTDQIDDIGLKGYTLYYKHRKNISRRRSGGIALAYKQYLTPYITIIETSSKLVIWFKISKQLTKTEDILCGIVYIPPEGSDYSAEYPYQEIEDELYSMDNRISNVLLLGDFNSRSRQLQDYIQADEFILKHFNSEDLTNEYEQEISYFESNKNVKLKRTNADTGINNYGYKLIDFCKTNNLFILNGRVGVDGGMGSHTCKNTSTVDYFISSAQLVPYLNDLFVGEFCEMFSDVHCPVTLTLDFKLQCANKHNITSETPSPQLNLWQQDKAELFVNNLNIEKLNSLNETILQCQENKHITQTDLDTLVENFNDIIFVNAETSFGYKHSRKPCTGDTNSTHWFGHRCSIARKKFHSARFQYKLRKDSETKNNLSKASKAYKRTGRKFYTKHKRKTIKNIRQLKYSNPRKYWQLLNGKKNTTVEASAESLFNFFKSANNDPNSNSNPTANIQHNENSNEYINGPFTEQEIIKVINKLKNNKASGIDLLLNEHLKSLSNTICPTIVNLFNLIFDTGMIPEIWTLGMIKPIYKNKGSTLDPANYRPITLLSCLGKVFTAALNNRIQHFIDEHEIINNCQTGFQKGNSTIDHIFTLHSLIDLVCKGKRKLFCAFIYLKQAFDRVWREGLWEKLVYHKIDGKCLHIIRKIYENIKSCVLVNNTKTEFFISNIGVRQGENLSPLLFIIFLNDLEEYFKAHHAAGIRVREHPSDETLLIYLKVFILLYADDTAILADSADDLQHALNIYADYCEFWRLTVNQQKSKVLIFSKGKLSHYSFELNNSTLEIVKEFKYLGILFSKNNSFLATKKQIAEQGSRALYSLLRKSRNMQLPIDIQIELFNKLVKPILLYGCEVWGFGNLEIIERVQLKFLKYILNLKTSTPNYIVYGETGCYPIHVDIHTRMISYWAKLVLPENFNTLSSQIYLSARSVYNFSNITNRSMYFKWVHSIKNLLDNAGFSGIWNSHDIINKTWLTKAFKQKMCDIFLSDWYQKVDKNSNYRLFKHTFEFETYLTKLPSQYMRYFVSFRTRNHKLPVETGRWHNIEYCDRKCNLCTCEIGDEFHFLLSCNKLAEQRKAFLRARYLQKPNVLKYENLMNSKNTKVLIAVAKFIKIIYTSVKDQLFDP